MKSLTLREIALVLVGCFVMGDASYSDEPETRFPEFDPITRPVERDTPETTPDSPRTNTRLSDSEGATGSGFRWPTLPKPKLPTLPKPTLPKLTLPSWSSEREMPQERMRRAQEPSTWEKFSTGSKDLLTKTKQTLMPWSQEESISSARKTPQPARRTPPKTASRTKAKSASSEKKSFFPWFSNQEEEKPMETVNDFLAQPRLR